MTIAVARPAAAEFAPRVRRAPAQPTVILPAPDVAATAAAMIGTWTCTGDQQSQPAQLALTITLDADRAWIQTTADETIDGASVLKYTEYRTYDPVSHAWTRLEMANTTAFVESTSLGDTKGTWTWSGTLHGQTTVEIRDVEKRTDASHLEMTGDERLAGAWQRVYAFSCSKR